MTFQSSPDFRVFNDIIEMRKHFLGIRDWGHPRYQFYPYPQRLCILSDMNRVYTLREIGDTEKYIQTEKEIMEMPGRLPSPMDTCILDMAIWTNECIKAMKRIEIVARKGYTAGHGRERVVLSLLCYGEEYTNKCLNYSFKSLMAHGNLPTLCREKFVIIHIQADNTAKELMESAPIVAKMKALGMHFEYCIIPDSLGNQINRESVYWLVGAAATLGIEFARTNNAAFHHCYPDIVYSDIFFAEMLRLSKEHSSILAPGHRGDEAVLLPSLKPYTSNSHIAVPSPDLIALELNAIHMAQWPGMVNNRTGNWAYPQNHNLIWETTNFVYLTCPHLNAWWLSKEVIAKAPKRFYISLDSELDFLCEGEDFYIPQEKDYAYMVEFSNQGNQKIEDYFLDAVSYAGYFWKLSTNRDNFKFFTRPMKVLINRQLRTNALNVLDEPAMINEMVFLFNTIQSKDPGIGTTLTRPRTHVGKIYGLNHKRVG